MTRFLFDFGQDNPLGFLIGQTGDTLQFGLLLQIYLIGFLTELARFLALLGYLLLSCFQGRRLHIQRIFFLLETVFHPADLVASVSNFLVQFGSNLVRFFFGLQNRFLFCLFGGVLAFFQQLSCDILRVSDSRFRNRLTVLVPAQEAYQGGRNPDTCDPK